MKAHRYFLHILMPTMLTWLTVSVAGADGLTLVPMGSVWKYLDTGTNLGTAWIAPLFDDSSWKSGPAQLGYGDGDEATLVGYGGDPGAKFITTYFRHSFVVTNAAAYSNLTLRLLRDDGAVIYLNGMEIARVGMPAGLVNFQTLAANSADENVLFVSSLVNLNMFPGIFVNGRNVLAVEIHQASRSSSDISFDLELADEPVALTSIIDLAATNATFTSPACLSLTTKAASQAGVTDVKFYVNGSEQTNRSMANELYATFPCTFDAPTNCSLAVAARDKLGTARTCSVDVVVEVIPHLDQIVSLVATGADWRYLDDGSDQDVAWQSRDFIDTHWAAGPAVLGHNRPEIVTTTRSGIMTTYFRHAFEVPTPSQFSKLALRVLRDDGVKVYLNGAEIFRNNLPSDPVIAATRALEPMDTTNFLSGADVDPALLVTGRNVLAVEMHQTATNATKLAFDLALTGITAPRLSVRLSPPTNVLITWPYPSTGFRLMETPSLIQPAWADVTNPLPVQMGDENQVPVAPPLDGRFYRLRRN